MAGEYEPDPIRERIVKGDGAPSAFCLLSLFKIPYMLGVLMVRRLTRGGA